MGNEGQGRGAWVEFGETHVDAAGNGEGKREGEKRQKQKGLSPPTSRERYCGVGMIRSDPDPWACLRSSPKFVSFVKSLCQFGDS